MERHDIFKLGRANVRSRRTRHHSAPVCRVKRTAIIKWMMRLPLSRTAGAVALITSQLSSTRATSAVALADYHAPAAALFSNVRVPAALIAGLAVPLGFAVPLPKTRMGLGKAMQRINTLLGVFVLSCELSVLSQSTVAIHDRLSGPLHWRRACSI